tara:strand:+ start:285 stop:836 length:552 start_codon:yes stop_codon:yes gene_type:complete
MNYSNTSSLICDYITLFFEDGNIDNGIGEWEIPSSSYYYQTRGNIAVVSLADAVFNTDQGSTNDTVIVGTDCGLNSSVAQVGASTKINNNLSFLGSIQLVAQHGAIYGVFNYFKTEPIKILTPARPSRIKLSFFKANDKSAYDITKGCVTLKFEYLSPETEKEVNDAVSYIPAFSEIQNNKIF